jgi:hypothetical protein
MHSGIDPVKWRILLQNYVRVCDDNGHGKTGA